MNVRPLFYSCALACASLALFAAWMANTGFETRGAAAANPPRVEHLSTTTPDTYFVERVIDGDTIDVSMNGTTTRVRLIGMDTPETVDPRKPVQCFGKEASAEGHALLDNQWVRLEYDPAAGARDKYGRALAYVFLADGTFYNEFMIARGFAHEYDYNGQKYEYEKAFRAAQAQARQEQLGFWSPATCAGNTTKPAST